jgi:hypothetical protein
MANGGSADITPLRRLGNQGLNGFVNLLFGTRFTDLCYGYNAFWRRVVAGMDLPDPALPRLADGAKRWGDGFEIETLLNIRVASRGYRVSEVPSFEYERIHGESNLNTFRDGMRVLRTIVREFLRRRTTKPAPAPARPVTVPAIAVRPARRAARALAAAPVRLTRQRGR